MSVELRRRPMITSDEMSEQERLEAMREIGAFLQMQTDDALMREKIAAITFRGERVH